MVNTAQVSVGPNEVYLLTILVTFLGAAVLSDLHSRRIPNLLVALMLAAGIALQALTAPSIGAALWLGLGGAGVGLVVLLPFYALGGMGAGDVKLLAATGSFLGLKGALLAGVCTLVAGAALGLIVMLHRFLRASTRARGPVELAPADSAPVQLPYSLAISVGALTAVITW